MSHKITENDAVFLAILPELFDGKGWHKLGIPTTDWTAANLARALFTHRMEPAGIFIDGEFQTGEDYYAVANDTNKPIGAAVGRVFRTPDNVTLYRFFEEAIQGTGYEVCSVGTLDNRNEFFIDAKGKLKSVAGREVMPYFGLNRMFGGKGSVVGAAHQTVMQCANTTEIFRSQVSEDASKMKNTLNIFEKLPQFKATIQASRAIEIQFDLAMEDAAQTLVNKDDAREAFAGYIATDTLHSKSIGRVNRLLKLFKDGKGNEGKNGADWFNAITDFFTHESAANSDTKDAEAKQDAIVKQWYASEHGKAREMKAKLASSLFVKGAFAKDLFRGFVQSGKNLIAKLKPEDKSTLE